MANPNWEHAHLFMDDAGTVVAESDLSSQVVDLTGGGGGSQTLAEVLVEGNTTGGAEIEGDSAGAGVAGTEVLLRGGDGNGAVNTGAVVTAAGGAANGDGGQVTVQGGAGGAGISGGQANLNGGEGDDGNWASAYVIAGGGAGSNGTVAINTDASQGVNGQALVSNGDGRTVWGGVPSAAAVPVAAPAGTLPFAYDTTAVTGGFYFWNGAAWVKVATIL